MSTEAKQEMPSFGDAVKNFKSFIVEEGLPPDLMWVFREDVSSNNRRILIKESLPSENEKLVESLYEHGCRRGLGVVLDVLCLLDSCSCCYIWLPKDEVEAMKSLTAGLKLRVPTHPEHGESVKSWLEWQVNMWLDGRSGVDYWIERIPRRVV